MSFKYEVLDKLLDEITLRMKSLDSGEEHIRFLKIKIVILNLKCKKRLITIVKEAKKKNVLPITVKFVKNHLNLETT